MAPGASSLRRIPLCYRLSMRRWCMRPVPRDAAGPRTSASGRSRHEHHLEIVMRRVGTGLRGETQRDVTILLTAAPAMRTGRFPYAGLARTDIDAVEQLGRGRGRLHVVVRLPPVEVADGDVLVELRVLRPVDARL